MVNATLRRHLFLPSSAPHGGFKLETITIRQQTMPDFSYLTLSSPVRCAFASFLQNDRKELTDRRLSIRKRVAAGKHEFNSLSTELGINHLMTPLQSPKKTAWMRDSTGV